MNEWSSSANSRTTANVQSRGKSTATTFHDSCVSTNSRRCRFRNTHVHTQQHKVCISIHRFMRTGSQLFQLALPSRKKKKLLGWGGSYLPWPNAAHTQSGRQPDRSVHSHSAGSIRYGWQRRRSLSFVFAVKKRYNRTAVANCVFFFLKSRMLAARCAIVVS